MSLLLANQLVKLRQIPYAVIKAALEEVGSELEFVPSSVAFPVATGKFVGEFDYLNAVERNALAQSASAKHEIVVSNQAAPYAKLAPTNKAILAELQNEDDLIMALILAELA